MEFDATAIWYTASTIAQSVAALLAVGAFLASWRRGDVLASQGYWLEHLRTGVHHLLGLEMTDPHSPPTPMWPSPDQRTTVIAYLMENHPDDPALNLWVGSHDDAWFNDHWNLVHVLRAAEVLERHSQVIRPRIQNEEREKLDGTAGSIGISRPALEILFHLRASLLWLFGLGGACLFISVAALPFAKFANLYPATSFLIALTLAISFVGTMAAAGYVVWAAMVRSTGWHEVRSAVAPLSRRAGGSRRPS